MDSRATRMTNFKKLFFLGLSLITIHATKSDDQKLIRNKRAAPICRVVLEDFFTLDPTFDMFRNYYRSDDLLKPEDFFSKPEHACDNMLAELRDFAMHTKKYRSNVDKEEKPHLEFIGNVTSLTSTEELIKRLYGQEELCNFKLGELTEIVKITNQRLRARKLIFISKEVCLISDRPAIECVKPLTYLTEVLDGFLPNGLVYDKSHYYKNCSEVMKELKENIFLNLRALKTVKTKVTISITEIKVITDLLHLREKTEVQLRYMEEMVEKHKFYEKNYTTNIGDFLKAFEQETKDNFEALNYTILCRNFDLARYLFEELRFFGSNLTTMCDALLKTFHSKDVNYRYAIDFISSFIDLNDKEVMYGQFYAWMEKNIANVSGTDLILLSYYVHRDFGNTNNKVLLDKMNKTVERSLLYFAQSARIKNFDIISTLKSHNPIALKFFLPSIIDKMSGFKDNWFHFVITFNFLRFATDMSTDIIPFYKNFRDDMASNKAYNDSVDMMFAYGLKMILQKHYGKTDETNQALLIKLLSMITSETSRVVVFHGTYIKNRDGYLCATRESYDEFRRILVMNKANNLHQGCIWLMTSVLDDLKFVIKNYFWKEYLYLDDVQMNLKYRHVFTWKQTTDVLPDHVLIWNIDMRIIEESTHLLMWHSNEYLETVVEDSFGIFSEKKIYPVLNKERTGRGEGTYWYFQKAIEKVKINNLNVPI